MIGFRYESGKKYARISESATVHPLASIGNPPEHRLWWAEELHEQYDGTGEAFQVVIKPGVRIAAFCTVDAGFKGMTIIGDRTWLMAGCHVAHDCVIGSDCEFSPGVKLAGHVLVGDRVKIGMGATVRQFVRIGDGARIGMGAVVLKDVAAGETVVGNPARPIRVHEFAIDALPEA